MCETTDVYEYRHMCVQILYVCAYLCQTVKQVWGLFLLCESKAQYC